MELVGEKVRPELLLRLTNSLELPVYTFVKEEMSVTPVVPILNMVGSVELRVELSM